MFIILNYRPNNNNNILARLFKIIRKIYEKQKFEEKKQRKLKIKNLSIISFMSFVVKSTDRQTKNQASIVNGT